jgi:hypothetical protein
MACFIVDGYVCYAWTDYVSDTTVQSDSVTNHVSGSIRSHSTDETTTIFVTLTRPNKVADGVDQQPAHVNISMQFVPMNRILSDDVKPS